MIECYFYICGGAIVIQHFKFPHMDFLIDYFDEILYLSELYPYISLPQKTERIDKIINWNPFTRFSSSQLKERFSLSDIVLSYETFCKEKHCQSSLLYSLWTYFSFFSSSEKNKLLQAIAVANDHIAHMSKASKKYTKFKRTPAISNKSFKLIPIFNQNLSMCKLFTIQDIGGALANLYYSKVFGDIVIYPFPSAWNQPKSYPYPFSLKQLWNKEYSKNLSDPDMQMIHGFCTPSEQYMDFLKRREKIVKEIKKALITHQLDEIKSHYETAESAFLRNIWKDALPRVRFVDPENKFSKLFSDDQKFEKEHSKEYSKAPSRKINESELKSMSSRTLFSSDEIADFFKSYYGSKEEKFKIEPYKGPTESKEKNYSESAVITYFPYILYPCISSIFLNNFSSEEAQVATKQEIFSEIMKFKDTYFRCKSTTKYSDGTAAQEQYIDENPIRTYQNSLGRFFIVQPEKNTWQRKAEINFKIFIFRQCMEICNTSPYHISNKVNYIESVFLFLYAFSQNKINFDEISEKKSSDDVLKNKPLLSTISDDFFFYVISLLSGKNDPCFFTLL